MKVTTRLPALVALLLLVALGSLATLQGRAEAQLPGDLAVTKTGPATVSPGGTITYTITISNVGMGPREMINFTDTLPTNASFVSWAQTSGPVFTTATVGAPVTAVTANRVLALNAGESAVFSLVVTANTGLANGTVITNPGAPNACQVTSTSTAFPENNTAPNNFCSASTTVQFVIPTITKSFTPTSVAVNVRSILTIIVTNPNTFTLTNVSFTDTLPAGLTIDPAGGVTGGGLAVCGTGGAGGGGTLVAAGNTISLTGNTRTAGSSCGIAVWVFATTPGTYPNTTGLVTSNETPPGGPASATLTVTALPPTPTPVPATPVPPTPTSTPVILLAPPVIPQVFQHVPQGIFNGSRNNTPTPVVRAAVAPAVDPHAMPAVRPPNTGDAGLKGRNAWNYAPLLVIATVFALSAGASWHWKRR